jgi:transcriptional regulator with XRE-family HTH domain
MTDRIQLILKSKNLSSSQFADEIQVQRSSISHILSGRNKPSLDFIMKILSTYPEVDADWLIFGKGQMVKQENTQPEYVEKMQQELSSTERKEIISAEKQASPTVNQAVFQKRDENIEKIVVFYSNGTFREFHSKPT